MVTTTGRLLAQVVFATARASTRHLLIVGRQLRTVAREVGLDVRSRLRVVPGEVHVEALT